MVAGVVKFAGSPPKLEPIKVNKNREVCGASKDSEALVVGPEGGVRGSVVLIEGDAGQKPEGELLLDNNRCVFVPHVRHDGRRPGPGEELGQRPAQHPRLSRHGGRAGKQTVFNLALPSAGQVIDITKKLSRPGPVRVLCDAHAHCGCMSTIARTWR